MAKTQAPINKMKKNKVPLKNGRPKELTNETSKELASAIDPGIIASCMNPRAKTEITPVRRNHPHVMFLDTLK
jgi:hypothetical protein